MRRMLIGFLLCGAAYAQPPAAIPTGLQGASYQSAVNAWLSWAKSHLGECRTASSLGFLLNGTDETALLNSTLASTSGVSCLAIDAWKTLRADGQVLAPITHAFRITGATGSNGFGSLPGGSTLDLRYAGSSNGGAKLFAGGTYDGGDLQSYLQIDNITITSGGSDCNPFIISSLVRLDIHRVYFLGTQAANAACNDAIIQGFGGDFIGYGSRITDNSFYGMAHVYTGNSQSSWEVNGVNITGNWIQGGNSTSPIDAAIKFTGSARGNQVHDNLLEHAGTSIPDHNYTCFALFTGAGVNNSFSGNQSWDGDSNTSMFCGNAAAIGNNIDKSNFVDVLGTTLTDSNWAENNNMPWRVFPFFFDGSGSALSGTTTRCGLMPYGGRINRFSMFADQSGTATITVKSVAAGSYTGPGSASTIGTETMTSAARKQDTTLSGWTLPIAANSMVCVSLSSPSTVTWVSGNVQVWEGK